MYNNQQPLDTAFKDVRRSTVFTELARLLDPDHTSFVVNYFGGTLRHFREEIDVSILPCAVSGFAYLESHLVYTQQERFLLRRAFESRQESITMVRVTS